MGCLSNEAVTALKGMVVKDVLISDKMMANMKTYILFTTTCHVPYIPVTDNNIINFFVAMVAGTACKPALPYYK